MTPTHPAEEVLQGIADGVVADEAAMAHVRACATCAAHVAAIRRLNATLALGSPAPATLRSRVPQGSAPRKARWPAVAMAAGLLLAAVLVWRYRDGAQEGRLARRDTPAADTARLDSVPTRLGFDRGSDTSAVAMRFWQPQRLDTVLATLRREPALRIEILASPASVEDRQLAARARDYFVSGGIAAERVRVAAPASPLRGIIVRFARP